MDDKVKFFFSNFYGYAWPYDDCNWTRPVLSGKIPAIVPPLTKGKVMTIHSPDKDLSGLLYISADRWRSKDVGFNQSNQPGFKESNRRVRTQHQYQRYRQ